MNDSLETGLRHRLRRALRRTEAQHLHLRPLLAEVEETLRAGARAQLPRQLAHFCDALQAHFDLEDQVLFPALHGLAPPFKLALEALSREHRAFLGAVRGMLEAAARVEAEALSQLRAALGEHERREEQLLESILGKEMLRGS